mmetsp:Transcript_32842/g.78599  ORF Transcript_32842/g.78599 Transcript_32842/m.78599 type:complete len:235 (-) Transcript_32842:84-788(-)
MHRGGKPDSMKGSGRGGLGLPHRRDPRTDRDRAMAMPAGAGSHRREYQHFYGESTDMVSEEYWSSDGAWGAGDAWREWEHEGAGLEEGGWAPPPAPASNFGDLERRIDTMSQEFTENLRRISEKDNEKFDLIFSILQQLQNRQAQLEETVRVLQTQVGATTTFGSVGSVSTTEEDVGSVNISSPASGVAGSVTSGSSNMVPVSNVMVVCQPNGMMQQMQQMPQVMYAIPKPCQS